MKSNRIKNIKDSQTANIFAQAIAMQKAGMDVVNLCVGEPDFPTPQNVKEAAKKAIDENHTKYTVNSGMIELRQAIANKLKEDNQLTYETDEIVVSAGAKQSVFLTLMSIINKGDEVIIPAPYWVSYPEIVGLAEGRPVIINTDEENNFKITPQQLKQSISSKTKAFILNNPSNPTGTLYSKDELTKIAEIVDDKDIYVVADEIYEKLIYDDLRFTSFAALNENIKMKTIVINGFSKAYAMTGWRLGYAAGPKDIIDGANKLQAHSTSNTASISQYAGLEALSGSQQELSIMHNEFEKRRNFALLKLELIPGISFIKPAGAFYIFPNISSYFDKEFDGIKIKDSFGLAKYLLNEARVAIVPGSAFGSDNHIRISYSTNIDNLGKGLDRISEALIKLW